MVPFCTGGPVLTHESYGGDGNEAFTYPELDPSTSTSAWKGIWWNFCRQDMRQFGVVHRNSCNALMADGSVRVYADADGDGQLNTGFGTEDDYSNTDFSSSGVGDPFIVGYLDPDPTDDDVVEPEVSETEMYARWDLIPLKFK